VLFTSNEFDKNTTSQKLLVRVKFTGNLYSYRTCVSVNGRRWNTGKLVYTSTRTHTRVYVQGDRLSGKPGNVREFGTCQGNVRDVVNSRGNVREKILSWKSVPKLFITRRIL